MEKENTASKAGMNLASRSRIKNRDCSAGALNFSALTQKRWSVRPVRSGDDVWPVIVTARALVILQLSARSHDHTSWGVPVWVPDSAHA